MASKPRFELPPQYNPHDVERRLYQRWLDSGVFTGHADSPKEPYVIVIPPPNVPAGPYLGHRAHHVPPGVLSCFERVGGPEGGGLARAGRAREATPQGARRVVGGGG